MVSADESAVRLFHSLIVANRECMITGVTGFDLDYFPQTQ